MTIDLDEVRSRFFLARAAGEEAETVGLNTSRLDSILQSWHDVGPLHDELKAARSQLEIDRAALHAVLNQLEIGDPTYAYVWKALHPDSVQCEELVWPMEYSPAQIQCPNWAIDTGEFEDWHRCGVHIVAKRRELEIEQSKKLGETWEVEGWMYQEQREVNGGAIYKSPIATVSFDNEIEADELVSSLRASLPMGSVVYSRRVSVNQKVDPAHYGDLKLIATNPGPDRLHDISSSISGVTGAGSVNLSNIRVNNSHSVNLKSIDGKLRLTCNDCDYTWEGDSL